MSARLDIPPAAAADRRPPSSFEQTGVCVRDVRRDERAEACALLGRAFDDDPVAKHLFPDPRSRPRRWARLSFLAARRMGRSALLLTSGALDGVALWQVPDDAELGRFHQLSIAASFVALTRSSLPRTLRLDALTSRHRPTGPHYYLAALGTERAERRRGVGGALVDAVLERADRERRPAYLESSKARNVPFYQRHGFEVVAELSTEDGLTIWPMIRPAR